jgi:hypothetical protein
LTMPLYMPTSSLFTDLNMNNNDIQNVNSLAFADPGGHEGIKWLGGNGWEIFESPDDASNAAGNLQFFSNNGRMATLSTAGNLYVTGDSVVIQGSSPNQFRGYATEVQLKSNASNAATLSVGTDGSPRIWSMDIYNRTYTNAANMFITSAGTLGRSTSSRKYKLLEEPVPDDLPPKILNLIPKTWYDKNACEAYADALSKGEDISKIDIPPIERIPGLIAEDVEAAGLGQYVVYGEPDEKGNRPVEGIMYDRLWTLLIPLVKELSEKVQVLQTRVEELEQKVNGAAT